MSSDHETKIIKKRIMDYLKRFPEAKDSPEGIARWWVKCPENGVKKAIKELNREKRLTKIDDGTTNIYGL
ncbi:MAG: hypothetical protein ACC630_08915, partial [Nitrospinota bacterium]